MADDPATTEDDDPASTDGSPVADRDAGDDAPPTDAARDRGDDHLDAERTAGEDAADADATDTDAADADAADADAGTGPVDSDADADSNGGTGADADSVDDAPTDGDTPDDVRKYARFKKVDGAQYDRVNTFLRDRTYVTAREWAIARLCADFRTDTGVEMTKIGENLPELVPFMTDTYTPQAVNQARTSFEEKVRKAGATFLYGAMSGFFTAEELDEMMYEVSEIAKFLLEVEGVDLSVEEELEAEERISSVMRDVREASAELREEELTGDPSDPGDDD